MQEACCTWPKCETEADRLREINADLLEALEGLVLLVHSISPGYEGGDPMEAARAAIAKATQ